MVEIWDCSTDIADQVAAERELHAFLNELEPWVDFGDCPDPRPEFTVFARIEMDWATDIVSVVFTPEGLAYFRAWMRRQGLDPVMCTS
jgi:hypothetical protein